MKKTLTLRPISNTAATATAHSVPLYEKNGKVGVLVSWGQYCGDTGPSCWLWKMDRELLFDERVLKNLTILQGGREEAATLLDDLGYHFEVVDFFLDYIQEMEIEWVEKGRPFKIESQVADYDMARDRIEYLDLSEYSAF